MRRLKKIMDRLTELGAEPEDAWPWIPLMVVEDQTIEDAWREAHGEKPLPPLDRLHVIHLTFVDSPFVRDGRPCDL